MRKTLKIILFFVLILLIIVSGFFAYCFIISSGEKLNEEKLVNLNRKTVYYDSTGNIIDEDYNGVSVSGTDGFPAYVKNAFIAIEDKRFYSHNGIDARSMARAILTNLFSFSFKEGASTISQQLIKNTHLSGEKTLKRKIIEIKLAKSLEKKYTKDEILEMYLNTIYFGNNDYGITEASLDYFSKTPEELSLSEAAALAGIINAPSVYSPYTDIEQCIKRRNLVLDEMKKQNYITDNEFLEAKNSNLFVSKKDKTFDYLYLAKKEADYILGSKLKYDSGFIVYTNYDAKMQNVLNDSIKDFELQHDYSLSVLSNDSKILAFRSSVGDVKRQIGSTIKPVLVYAPAIEYDYISPLSLILDEKTNFGGYSPSNYNDKYYGYISASFSLQKSLNVCSVKLLNSVGIDKCKNFAIKAGLPLTDNDDSLKIALGSTENGIKLTDICSSYNIFSNNGKYIKPHCISKITDSKGNIIYSANEKENDVCSKETAFLINSMLYDTVKTGTAKNLFVKEHPVCAKTGTVGNDEGNSDSLTISYTPEFTVGAWIGNADGSLMDNSVTGGTIPCIISKNIWSSINKNYTTTVFEKPEKVLDVSLDKISYEKDNKILLSSKETPKRFCLHGYFKEKTVPTETSDRFFKPYVSDIKTSINSNGITFKLCLADLIEAKIYRQNFDKKTLVYDTKGKEKIFTDKNLINGYKYKYSIIPYYNYEGEIILGNEVFLDEIKFSPEEDDWWIDF